MVELISHSKFKYIIKRKTPCIISIEDKSDHINIDIHRSLEQLSIEFPFVLYYKIRKYDYQLYHNNKSIYNPHKAVCFLNGEIIAVVDGTKYDDLQKLFWKVYYDSCNKNMDGFLHILISENRLPRDNGLERPNQKELDILAKYEGGILSKLIHLPFTIYPKASFTNRQKVIEDMKKTKSLLKKRNRKYKYSF